VSPIKKIITKKAEDSTSKGNKWQRSLSPRSREAGNINYTTLVQGITRIGTERAMKNHRKMLHEVTTHVPMKSTEGDKFRPPHVCITFGTQRDFFMYV
jgi:hypothetical protein